MEFTAATLASFGIGLLKVLVFLGFLVALWKILNLVTRSFDDHAEIFERGNWGYLIQRLGITAAQAAGMVPLLGVVDRHHWSDLGWLAVGGSWVALLLLVAHPVIDRTVALAARKVEAAREDDIALSMVKATFYLAFGFVVNGSMTGSAPNWGTAAASVVVFTILGAVLLVGGYLLLDAVSRISLRKGVAQGRLAPSFEAAGVLIALGLIIRNAIAGDFTSWGAALSGFAFTAVAALVVVWATRWVFDAVMLTGSTIREVHESNHVIAAAMLAAFLPLVALPVTAVVGASLG
ncbi:DUF350 domain-containing protein [Pilimelia columellifera]|uniref:DUF350 domain-containing protein n=1 Tax=Pilimelia columellifera subsp. columellifera TaxID=706583 RepID=A0ABP6AHM8_9ACTN